ncbi:hypothetical protein LZG07_00865 [Microbacterium profundi]|uniref:hypothetical protein n=1 Tax=Microbacterium profundi TaxID=450380 RepID=UPI0019D2FE67|nr:hypothetical protein [Microbacterium profundi]MCE7480492.1 hypothetical protein [Microbacterium profundi]
MDQRPIEGAAPLPVPNSDIAQAYLDQVRAVRERREAGVDRRGAAWIGLVNAITLAVYITVISPRWGIAIVLGVVLLVALAVFFIAGILGVEMPFFVRLIPGALALVVLGAPALGSILGYGPIGAAVVFCLYAGSAFLDGRDG